MSENAKYSSLTQLIKELRKQADDGLSKHKARAALYEIEQAIKELGLLAQELDPVKRPENVFDPRDPTIVGLFVGMALVAQERRGLNAVTHPFYGSGVYALYYAGDFKPYVPISKTEHPIYVGKADPQEPQATEPRSQGTKLFGRLGEHRKSITKAQNLSIDDFNCRYLVVQSGLQRAAEDYLINLFDPVWNDKAHICYGLGKHGDSPHTRRNVRSPWDTLHPGRKWAVGSPQGGSPEQIRAAISAHLSQRPLYKSVEEILAKFFEHLKQK
jgi:hypothetical protein